MLRFGSETIGVGHTAMRTRVRCSEARFAAAMRIFPFGISSGNDPGGIAFKEGFAEQSALLSSTEDARPDRLCRVAGQITVQALPYRGYRSSRPLRFSAPACSPDHAHHMLSITRRWSGRSRAPRVSRSNMKVTCCRHRARRGDVMDGVFAQRSVYWVALRFITRLPQGLRGAGQRRQSSLHRPTRTRA